MKLELQLPEHEEARVNRLRKEIKESGLSRCKDVEPWLNSNHPYWFNLFASPAAETPFYVLKCMCIGGGPCDASNAVILRLDVSKRPSGFPPPR